MKRIVLLMLVFLCGCNEVVTRNYIGADLELKCINNHAFVVYHAAYAGGITQFMIKDNGENRPLKCDEIK